MTNTKDINKIPKQTYQFGKKSDGYHTTTHFYFKEGGTKYYIDNIGSDCSDLTIRNSKTGQSKIILYNTDLRMNPRFSGTFFFQYD